MARELSYDEFVQIEEGISLEQLQEIKYAFQVEWIKDLKLGCPLEFELWAEKGPALQNSWNLIGL